MGGGSNACRVPSSGSGPQRPEQPCALVAVLPHGRRGEGGKAAELMGGRAQDSRVSLPRSHRQALQKARLVRFCLFVKRIINAGGRAALERVASRCSGGWDVGDSGLRGDRDSPPGAPSLVQHLHVSKPLLDK